MKKRAVASLKNLCLRAINTNRKAEAQCMLGMAEIPPNPNEPLICVSHKTVSYTHLTLPTIYSV